MKKLVFVAISVLLLLFLGPLFRKDFYQSHDGEAHVARFAAYYKAYSDGQLPARWAGDLNFNYGSPVFIFYYPLPGMLASILHFLGLSFENAFKIIIAASFVGAALSFYLWISVHVKKDVAFIGALLYGLAPYHFLNLYVRGDIAEIMALAIMPLVLFLIDKIARHKNITTLIMGTLVYALLVLSHNAISLMFSPVILLYSLLYSKEKKQFFLLMSMLLCGLMLSSFFWLPALYESKYTNAHLFIGDMYKEHFLTLTTLVYSHWGFGPDVNKSGGLSPQLGVLYVVFSIAAILLSLRKKFTSGENYWVVVFLIGTFMTTAASSFIWNIVPLLQLFQFPWRMIALSSFAACVLAVFVLNKMYSKKLLFVTVVALLIISVPLVKVEKFITRTDNYYLNYKGTTYYHGQASSIWTAGDAGEAPKRPIDILEGKGQIDNIYKKSNKHTFIVNAESAVKVVDNTVYFPGWQVFVNGQKVPIEFQDMNYRGLITFSVPQGQNKVEVRFGESPVRFFANGISLTTLVIGIIVLFYRRKKDNAFS